MMHNPLLPAKKYIKKLIFGLAAISIGVGTLRADDKFKFEARLSALSPTGNLKDIASTGFGASFGAGYAFNGCFGLRGKAEYLLFGEKKSSGPAIESKDSVASSGIMADILFGSIGAPGPYGFVGGGLFGNTNKRDINLLAANFTYSEKNSATASVAAIGFGWRFTPSWDAEIRYTKSFGDFDGGDRLQASVGYRFGIAQNEQAARAQSEHEAHGHEDEGLLWEVELLGTMPTGEMKELYPFGFGAALGAEYVFNERFGLKAGAEARTFGLLPKKKFETYFGEESYKVVETEITAEAIFGSLEAAGPYGLLGLGLHSEQETTDYTVNPPYTSQGDQEKATLGGSSATAGFGWRFTEEWSAEARYTKMFGDFGGIDSYQAALSFNRAPFEPLGKAGAFGHAAFGIKKYPLETSGYLEDIFSDDSFVNVGLGWRFKSGWMTEARYTKMFGYLKEKDMVQASVGFKSSVHGRSGAPMRHKAPASHRAAEESPRAATDAPSAREIEREQSGADLRPLRPPVIKDADSEGFLWEIEFLGAVPTGEIAKEMYPTGLGIALGTEYAFNERFGIKAGIETLMFGYLPEKKIDAVISKMMETEINAEAVFGALDTQGPYGFVGAGLRTETQKADWDYSGFKDSSSEKYNGPSAAAGFGWRFTEEWSAEARYAKMFGDFDGFESYEAKLSFNRAPFEPLGKIGPYGFAACGMEKYEDGDTNSFINVGYGWRFNGGWMAEARLVKSFGDFDERDMVQASVGFRFSTNGRGGKKKK